MIEPINITLRRPLISLAAAAAIANEPTDAITEAVDSGAIRFAFDVAQPDAARRAIRVLSQSLAKYIERVAQPPEQPGAFARVVESLFPALAQNIRTDTLCRVLDCDRKHIFRLSKCRVVECVNQYRRGNGGTARFSRRSCVDFLISRRLT